MPRRRIPTAKQSAASRRNLQKARAAKKPHGKMLALYHTTDSASAFSISSRGFKSGPDVWFSTSPRGTTRTKLRPQGDYGIVKVSVPFRKAKPDYNAPRMRSWKVVKARDLSKSKPYVFKIGDTRKGIDQWFGY